MIKFKFKEIELDKGRAVVKVNIGKHFIITKCSNITWLTEEIGKVYKKYHYKNGVAETNLHLPLVEKAAILGIENGHIEVLFQSTNGYDVLKYELEQLESVFGKRYCLNRNSIPYVPKFKSLHKTTKWLTQNEYLNFMKLLKKYNY